MEYRFSCNYCNNTFTPNHRRRKYCSKLCYQHNIKYRAMKRNRDELFWKLIRVGWYISISSILIISSVLYIKLNRLQSKLRGNHGDKKIIQRANT